MSYVGDPFRHDIFVSYSHGDARGDGRAPLRRWSEMFAEQLREQLETIPSIGSKLSLFLDGSDRPGESVDHFETLSDSVRDAIQSSAIVVVLMSPHYLRSAWCEKEREWWLESQKVHGFPVTGRFGLAHVWALAEGTALPPGLADLLPFWFYDQTRPNHPQPFAYPTGPDRNFDTVLLDLVNHLSQRLAKVREQVERRERERRDQARLAGERNVVYLHAREDERERWAAAKQELREHDFVVFPTEPDRVSDDFVAANRARVERIRALGGCDALLLLAPENGNALDADLLAVGRGERNSARALTNRLLPSAVLDTVGNGIAERRSNALGLQVDWIDATQKPFAPTVKQWLASKANRAAGDAE